MTSDAVKPAPDGVLISRELLAFLCGDGPLDGHYFGEKPEHERGNFWWRKALRAAENAALEQAGEPVAAVRLEAVSAPGIVCPTCEGEEPACIICGGIGRVLPLPTLQRLGQEFDAAEAVAWRYTRYDGYIIFRYNWDHKLLPPWTDEGVWTETPLYAHPPQSRGQAFDGEGEALEGLVERLQKAIACPEDLERLSRDKLGNQVREVWVRWALQQPNPKAHWLVPYAELGEPDKEVDRQIGQALARLGAASFVHQHQHLWREVLAALSSAKRGEG